MFKEPTPGNTAPSAPERSAAEQAREWQNRRIERLRESFARLGVSAKAFLENDELLDPQVLKNGVEAEQTLLYADEYGYIDINGTIYHAKQNLGIEGERFYRSTKERAPKFHEAVFYASGRTGWMRGHYSDMSNTVPLMLRREQLQAEIEELGKLADFYKTKIVGDPRKDGYPNLDEEIARLTDNYSGRYAEIQTRANPYISADMKVALDHFDEYKKLRQEFLRAGGEKQRLIGTDELARHLLSLVHTEEYRANLSYFEQHPEEKVELAKRNELIRFGADLDQKWSQEHPI